MIAIGDLCRTKKDIDGYLTKHGYSNEDYYLTNYLIIPAGIPVFVFNIRKDYENKENILHLELLYDRKKIYVRHYYVIDGFIDEILEKIS